MGVCDAMTTQQKVVFEKVTKLFQRKGEDLEVLRDIDLSVAQGEFVCLLGPSGCGKSTLLNIAGGFERPTSGRVLIDGESVLGPDSRRVFVFQEYGIFPWASVWDNVALGLRQLSKDEQQRIVSQVIELVGLKGFESTYPQELSGGMKQRVEVARALAVDPDVIFMDEPFGALDSLTRLSLRAELIRIWHESGKTILFVTHDVDESIQLAQRIVVFTDRPGCIREILSVPMEHPRDLGSPEYGQIKNRLYDLLGVSHQV
jgi:ABC-type nitrate/sulfonate/bicarbonate transport system ATPase subunit